MTRQGWRVIALVDNFETKNYQDTVQQQANGYYNNITKTQLVQTTHFLLGLETDSPLTELNSQVNLLQNQLCHAQFESGSLSREKEKLEAEMEKLKKDYDRKREALDNSQQQMESEIRSERAKAEHYLALNEAILDALPKEDWGVILSRLPQDLQDKLAPKLKSLVLNTK